MNYEGRRLKDQEGTRHAERPGAPRSSRPRVSCYARAAATIILATAGCTGPTPGGNTNDRCDDPGVICTVAGTGQSLFDGDGKNALETSFYYPLDVAFDDKDRLLIVDFNNLRIRRLNDNGRIETIMGLDYEDYPVEGALAVDTPLHHPSDIEFDAQGRLLVAGDHAPVVFAVGIDQRVRIIAGNGDFGYSGDGGPALDAALTTPFGVFPDSLGGVYVSDYDAHVVRYVDPAGTIETVAGTGNRGYSGDGGPGPDAQLFGPTRLRLDDQNRLLICDTDNHAIRRLDPNGAIHTIAGNGTPGYSGDGGPASDAVLDSPYDLRITTNGDLYFADAGNSVIRRIDVNGTMTTVVGNGVSAYDGDGEDFRGCSLNRPSGIHFAPDGTLWIADAYNHRVRKISAFLSEVD